MQHSLWEQLLLLVSTKTACVVHLRHQMIYEPVVKGWLSTVRL